uniref:Uncharacterized protein n=1 Tax=Anguilla anguilla TaxID=7936 RepID=A0A0E9TBL1_ANGAN
MVTGLLRFSACSNRGI